MLFFVVFLNTLWTKFRAVPFFTWRRTYLWVPKYSRQSYPLVIPGKRSAEGFCHCFPPQNNLCLPWCSPIQALTKAKTALLPSPNKLRLIWVIQTHFFLITAKKGIGRMLSLQRPYAQEEHSTGSLKHPRKYSIHLLLLLPVLIEHKSTACWIWAPKWKVHNQFETINKHESFKCLWWRVLYGLGLFIFTLFHYMNFEPTQQTTAVCSEQISLRHIGLNDHSIQDSTYCHSKWLGEMSSWRHLLIKNFILPT